MKISKKLYIDHDIPYYKWLMWRLRRNKSSKQIYCICMAEKKGYFLEIINSKKIGKQHEKSILIGIATTRQNAIGLTARIFDEIYVANPNLEDLKNYFKQ